MVSNLILCNCQFPSATQIAPKSHIRRNPKSEGIRRYKKIPEAEDWRTDKSIHSSWTGKKILGIKAQECTRLLWTDPPGQPAAFDVFASPVERLHPLRSKGHQRSKGPQVRSRLPCLQPVNVIYALSFPLGPKWHMDAYGIRQMYTNVCYMWCDCPGPLFAKESSADVRHSMGTLGAPLSCIIGRFGIWNAGI